MRAKVHEDGGDVLPGAPPLQALGGRQLVGEAVRPRLGQFLALARALLIGPHLIDQSHEKVGVEHGVEHVVDHRQRQAEAGVLLDAREAEGDHRHIAVPRLFKRLAQKGDVVRGAAAAAGLEQHQRHLVRVVFAALQGVDELADDEYGRIAGVVVHILEARVADLPAPWWSKAPCCSRSGRRCATAGESASAACWARGWCIPRPSSPR